MKLMQLKNLMTGAALSALVAGGAIAQDSTAPAAPTGMDTMTDSTISPASDPFAPGLDGIEDMTVGQAVGMVAHDPQGDRIGDIDYIVDGPEGPMAVIGIGGFIGLGEYTVALALEEFRLDEDASGFTLDTDKETLKAQPEIDESTLESLPDDTPIAALMEPRMDDPAKAGTAPDAPATGAGESTD